MDVNLPVLNGVALLPCDATTSTGAPIEINKHRYRVLDGIRGLAIIAVLLTHGSYVIQSRLASRLTEAGWTGVDLFFVLSGFLITGILIDTKSAVNRGRSFYARRVLRIFPIYYLTLAVVLLAQMRWAWVADCAGMPSLSSRLPYIFYFVNIVPLWHHGEAHQTMLQHFWSLAVEEQFYFLWPLVVWHLTTKAVYKLCGVALCLTLALRIVAGSHFGFGPWIFLCPLTRADGLLVGSALAALLASKCQPSKRLLAGLASAAVLGLAAISLGGYRQLFYGGPLMSTFGFTSLAILFGVFVAYSILFSDAALPQALQAKWLCNFGRYSYGMYVFHLPIYYLFEHLAKTYLSVTFPLRTFESFAYLGLLIAITYGVAWVSFNFFEQHFLRLKDRFAPEFPESAVSAEPDHAPVRGGDICDVLGPVLGRA